MVNIPPNYKRKNEVTLHQDVAFRCLNPDLDKEYNNMRSFCAYLDMLYEYIWNSSNKDMCIWMQFILLTMLHVFNINN
jgi:hypothetical protein